MELLSNPTDRPRNGSVVSIRDFGPERTIKMVEDIVAGNDTLPQSPGSLVATLFLNRSLRTRLGVAKACAVLGASHIDLEPNRIYSPIISGPGEPYKQEAMEDIVRVINLNADCLAVRAYGPSSSVSVGAGDAVFERMLRSVTVPVINLETDSGHPIQAMADVATVVEHCGTARGRKVVMAWAHSPEPKPIAVPASFVMAASAAGAHLVIAAPSEFSLPASLTRAARDWAGKAGGSLTETSDLGQALDNADILYMKSWMSWEQKGRGHQEIAGVYHHWMASEELFHRATPKAGYLHCLPADRGLEVTDDLLDGERSLIWRQVEMRRRVTQQLLANALRL